MKNKPIKRIAMVDDGIDPVVIRLVLERFASDYDLIFTSDLDADYIFHSCRGYEVLNYSGIRIFVTGENVSPNFNISDYAMAFDRMAFADRCCWLPVIKLTPPSYEALPRPRRPVDEVMAEKDEFCAYVMSNTKDSAPERSQIFDLLSAYKTVNSGGRWRNNVGGPVPDKRAFQSKHKFVIAFENSSTPGYFTEKFGDAAAADAVPIYWGDPTIGEYINPKAFINCHNFESMEAVVEEVKRIDQDDALYRQMLSEPWFPDGVEPEVLKDEYIRAFLAHIFDQPHELAYRRNRSRWGIKHEQALLRMYQNPLNHGIRLLHKRIRKRQKKRKKI